MIRLFQTTLALFILSLITGCMATTTRVVSKVESFSQLPKDAKTKTIYIAPFEAQDPSSLQWQSNILILSSKMREKGMHVVSDPNMAEYIGYFGYSIDSGRSVTSSYNRPQFGVTGYSGATTQTYRYGNTTNTTTSLTPTYGVVSYNRETVRSTEYTRSVKLDIFQRATNKIVFDGKAVSTGSCHSFSPVAPYILEALLSEFPNATTGTREIAINDDYQC